MSNIATATEESRVTRRVCYDGIPLEGIGSVKSALQDFADGKSANSFATNRQLQNDGEVGSMASLLKLVYVDGNSNDWMQRMFRQIESDIAERGSSRLSFDYDGIGRFFKTTVTVKTFDKAKEIYLLGLNAAYVGSQVEDDLAEALGVEQAVIWTEVNVKFPATNDQFHFDFEEIFSQLKAEMPEIGKQIKEGVSEDITATSIVDDFFQKTNFNDLVNSSTLFRNDKFELKMSIADVEGPISYKSGTSKMVWNRNGNTVSGPTHAGYSEPPKPLVPAIAFSISSLKKNDYERLQIIDPTIKAEMFHLAERLEAIFS